ncbi:MAG: histidine triad nucleotide-binding protein [Ethanoligenens sp.]
MDCIFCKIAAGEIPCKKLYEDEQVLAFHDIDPKAPVHFLVIPKTHIGSASEITSENSAVVAHIFEVIAKLTAQLDLKNGYRVVTNCGKDAGQSVEHLHFHVLAGRLLYPDMA